MKILWKMSLKFKFPLLKLFHTLDGVEYTSTVCIRLLYCECMHKLAHDVILFHFNETKLSLSLSHALTSECFVSKKNL